MRRFVAQVLINAVATFVVLALLSLIHVGYTIPTTGESYSGPLMDLGGQPIIFAVTFGFLLALVNAIVRPVILLLTGRLVIRSLGLMYLVVSIVTFVIALWIDPLDIAVAQPTWLWVAIAAILVSTLSLLAQLILGVQRPRLDVSDRQRATWRLLDRLPTPRRSAIVENLRLMEVYETISTYGFDIGLEGTALAGVRDWAQRYLRSADPRLQGLTPQAKVRVMLQQLGPTYVKIGQMAASRAEALPPGWADELEKLQNTVPPFAYEEAAAIIEAELGAPPESVYATFEREPLAAASLAQVHRATLPDGRPVVVKIQRPDIQTMVRADLGVLQELAVTGEKRFEAARRLDVRGVVEEFSRGVLVELDYRNEAYHMRRMDEAMAAIPGVRVPDVDDARSASRVLTMDFVQGVKINDTEALDAAGIDRDDLARRFLRAIVKQIMVDGFFHADPHPGNVFVDPADGTITFLDLGLVGQLTTDQRMDLLDLVASVQSRDSAAITAVALRLCAHRGPVDTAAVRRSIDRVVYQYLIYGAGTRRDMGVVVSSILGALYEQGLRMDQDFTLAIKAVIQAEEITRTLSPSFSLLEEATSDARSLILEQLTAERIVKEVRSAVIQTGKEVVRRLPSLTEATLSWLDQYQKGKLVVEVDASDLSREVAKVGDVGRLIGSSAVMAGALIATGIVLAAVIFSGLEWDFLVPLPLVLGTMFIALVVGALVFMWRTVRSMRRPDEPT